MSSTGEAAAGTALVTGASSGIGQATVRRLATVGYRVFGTSRRSRANEDGVEMLDLDVRSDESTATCVQDVLGRAGHIDVLVNNAGVLHEGFAEETTLEEAAEIFDTNLFGVARVTNAVLPSMRARGQGRIINIGSLAARIGEPGEGFYAASKAALARYTEALRHEVWHLGIHVSLVEPGAFTTRVLDAATTTVPRIQDYDGPREAAHRTLHNSLRQGRDPRRVADLVATIARKPRPRARYGAGPEAWWIPLLAAVPQPVADHLLRRAYRLPGRPTTPG